MKYFTTLLLFLLTRTANSASPKLRGADVDGSSVLCLIVQAHETREDGHREFYMCDLILEKARTVAYGLKIDLPEDVVEENESALYRGEWFVSITGATIEETFIELHGMVRTGVSVPQGAIITTVAPEDGKMAMLSAKRTVPDAEDVAGERRLSASGTHSLLILRVSVSDASPSFSASQLAEDFFGNSFSVATQYNGCSFGAIRFQAYDSSNPVVDVVVPGKASSFTNGVLWPLAMAAGASQKGVGYLTDIAQHVAIIVPVGLSDSSGWYAVGSVGGWWSLYNDKWGGFPNFGVHELGHNLGMGHAGVGSDPYADESDIMGYGDPQQFGISKCFNGYHYWFLNWFASRSISVDPFTHNVLTLAAFSDYDQTNPSQYVVIKVGDYYLLYNRATGINSGVNDVPDTVTIAQATSGVFSLRVAALSSSSSTFQINNYNGGSKSLNFIVCSMATSGSVDYAVVSIGVGVTDCNGGVAFTQSTNAPLTPRQPTVRPTKAPVANPTPPPRVTYTLKPTNRHRRSPTRSPGSRQ